MTEQERTPLEKHVAKFGLAELNQACEVVGMRIYTANDFQFTIQDGDGTATPYTNNAEGIDSAWKLLGVVCEELNRNHPLQRGPRVLPPRTPPPAPAKKKYQRVAIHTERLEDIDMLFDMTADWLRGFDGDQPEEAFAALRYLHNTLFPERTPFCEDCGALNSRVGYHTEVHGGERQQCFTCFKKSYQEEHHIAWTWAFYPGHCEECGDNTDLVQVGTEVMCKKCKEENA